MTSLVIINLKVDSWMTCTVVFLFSSSPKSPFSGAVFLFCFAVSPAAGVLVGRDTLPLFFIIPHVLLITPELHVSSDGRKQGTSFPENKVGTKLMLQLPHSYGVSKARCQLPWKRGGNDTWLHGFRFPCTNFIKGAVRTGGRLFFQMESVELVL